MLILAILIISRESSKVGSIKSQQIILTEQSHFKFNASEVLTMNGVNYFYTEQFLPRVREFQIKSKTDTSKLIPTDPKFFNSEHYSTIENIICNQTSFKYQESEIIDLIGVDLF